MVEERVVEERVADNSLYRPSLKYSICRIETLSVGNCL